MLLLYRSNPAFIKTTGSPKNSWELEDDLRTFKIHFRKDKRSFIKKYLNQCSWGLLNLTESFNPGRKGIPGRHEPLPFRNEPQPYRCEPPWLPYTIASAVQNELFETFFYVFSQRFLKNFNELANYNKRLWLFIDCHE